MGRLCDCVSAHIDYGQNTITRISPCLNAEPSKKKENERKKTNKPPDLSTKTHHQTREGDRGIPEWDERRGEFLVL
jgi:hypothetical protein